MDITKTRRAAAAKLYWLQQEMEDGGTPSEDEVNTLADYVDPVETLTTAELELLRIAYLALQHDYLNDGIMEIPDEAERAQLARQMLE